VQLSPAVSQRSHVALNYCCANPGAPVDTPR
jgi:hypothetical protein